MTATLPRNFDGNGDGIADRTQPTVYSIGLGNADNTVTLFTNNADLPRGFYIDYVDYSDSKDITLKGQKVATPFGTIKFEAKSAGTNNIT